MTMNISLWNITMFFVHLAAFSGVLLIYRGAPCWMQRLALVGFGIAMFVACCAFAAAMSGYEHYRWPVFTVALVFEHLAVMLYLFRIVYQDHLQWKPSSANFPKSSG